MEQIFPGVSRVELRTPTLPPATHTNTWVLGRGALTVVDPASPYDDERQRLVAALEERLAGGERVERLFLTHHHHDHVSGALHLQAALAARGHVVPIAAHPVTAARLGARLPVDELVEDGAELLPGVVAVFTPGHAPGHLCLAGDGWIVAGDMVAGTGTILIDPADGDLGDYLASLDRLRSLGRDALLPAHGPVLPHAATVLSMYVAHRHARSEQCLQALDQLGTGDAAALVPVVYQAVDPRAWPIAALQVESHLRWLARHGRVRSVDGGYAVAR
jgi:glyoxylase-like metal-dependent hydrolase (beta-lactamase superfamily II)